MVPVGWPSLESSTIPFSFHSVDHEGLLTLLVEPPAQKVLIVICMRPTDAKFLFELERDALGHLDDAMATINGSSVCRASLWWVVWFL
jgi:hypothetical protein